MNIKNPLQSILLIFFLFFAGCGYQLVGDKGIYGGEIKSVHMSVFKNITYEPHISLYFTQAFTSQLMATGIFEVNKRNAETYLEGLIKHVKTSPNALDKNGIVIEKNLLVTVELSLFRRDGNLIRRWSFTDSYVYRTDDRSIEDYNKKEAFTMVSDRIAKRFCASIMTEY